MRKPVRIGVGGPVGSGKTALLDCLCKAMRGRYQLAVVTNDIFTREDMEFLVRSEALKAVAEGRKVGLVGAAVSDYQGIGELCRDIVAALKVKGASVLQGRCMILEAEADDALNAGKFSEAERLLATAQEMVAAGTTKISKP